MPIELVVESWQTVNGEAMETREDLILARMQQLDRRRISNAIAAGYLHNSWKSNKVYFDQHHCLRPQNQQPHQGDLVLLYDSSLQANRNTKLNDRSRGPFRITEKSKNSTFYRLEELDGTPLSGTTAGDRVKKFYSRKEMEEILWNDENGGSNETLMDAVTRPRESLGEEDSIQSDGDEQTGLQS